MNYINYLNQLWKMALELEGKYWDERDEWHLSAKDAFRMLREKFENNSELTGSYGVHTANFEEYESWWGYDVARHAPGDLYPNPCLVFKTWSNVPGEVTSYSYSYL